MYFIYFVEFFWKITNFYKLLRAIAMFNENSQKSTIEKGRGSFHIYL